MLYTVIRRLTLNRVFGIAAWSNHPDGDGDLELLAQRLRVTNVDLTSNKTKDKVSNQILSYEYTAATGKRVNRSDLGKIAN